MPGLPLSLPEREEISFALIENRWVSWAEIARRIGRHPTTISREVEANGGRGKFRPALAQDRAIKSRHRPRHARLELLGELRDRVTRELKQGRSPVAIWADLVAEGVKDRVCPETIYAAVFAGVLEIKPTQCLRSRRPRRRKRKHRNESKRPGLPNISVRPQAINDRRELGHWEGDQIIGANNRSSMLWLTERVTRYSIGTTMPNGYCADEMLVSLTNTLEKIPSHLLSSITFDQGSEWAAWKTLVSNFGIDIWFCDPHSPWQRGQVENLNRQWRWWFPRGMNLKNAEQQYVDDVGTIINGQRRRSLDYQSPTELYMAASLGKSLELAS